MSSPWPTHCSWLYQWAGAGSLGSPIDMPRHRYNRSAATRLTAARAHPVRTSPARPWPSAAAHSRLSLRKESSNRLTRPPSPCRWSRPILMAEPASSRWSARSSLLSLPVFGYTLSCAYGGANRSARRTFLRVSTVIAFSRSSCAGCFGIRFSKKATSARPRLYLTGESSMFTNGFAHSASIFTLLAATFGLAGSEAKDCCSAKLACCKPPSACCAAEAKLGCCDKPAACCAQAQQCCTEGKPCCDEAKECCGPQKPATSAKACCSAKS
jgi:hypothetical protein